MVQVQFYKAKGRPYPIPSKGCHDNTCIVSPYVGLPRCTEKADTFEGGKDWRCDKPVSHKGPHISFERTLMGVDTSVFALWRTP